MVSECSPVLQAILLFVAWMIPVSPCMATVPSGSSGISEPPAVRDSRKNQPDLPRVEVGKAVAEQLPWIFAPDAGPYAMGQAGDWRLSNGQIRLTFASIENRPSTTSTPLSGEMDLLRAGDRIPGALIDVSLDGYPLDMLGYYTQGIGTSSDDIVIEYDEIDIVTDEKSVGLRFGGSPFDHGFIRIETTYWIRENSERVRIETRFLDLPDGLEIPPVCDVAFWGDGRLYVGGDDIITSRTTKNHDLEHLFCNWGKMTIAVAPLAGKVTGRLRGFPSQTRVLLDDTATTETHISHWLVNDDGTTEALSGTNVFRHDIGTSSTRTSHVVMQDPGAADGANILHVLTNDPGTTMTEISHVLVRDPRTKRTGVSHVVTRLPRRSEAQEARVFIEDLGLIDTQGSRILSRDMWVTQGYYGDAYANILRDRGIDYGTLKGELVFEEDGRPVPNGIIEANYLTRPGMPLSTRMYARADSEGFFQMLLPRDVYVIRHRSVIESKKAFRGIRMDSRDLLHYRNAKIRIEVEEEASLEVKVVDEETSAPLAARVRIKSIYPTPPLNFGPPRSAAGYFDMAYIPVGGRSIPLIPGDWTLEVYHGIEYDRTVLDIHIESREKKRITVPLAQSNPTPGWTSVEAGVRTVATPGNMVGAEDIVLMAAAEGVDWVITGDFETLTDLSPVIRGLGLEGQVRSIMGFRTAHPKFVEWGQFFLYPIGPHAKDPLKARNHWINTESSEEFIAALRGQYPGAIIQSDLPYTHTGKGYFSRGDGNPYRVGYTTADGVDPTIDAVALMRSRGVNELKEIQGFWFYNWIDGRSYIPGIVPTGQTVFGSEPGYPRMLVYVGKDDLSRITPAELITAIKGMKIQITNGPFIDFSVGEINVGGHVPLDLSLPTRLRITAPNWVVLNHFVYEKEGKLQAGLMSYPGIEFSQRYPNPEKSMAQYDVQSLRAFKIVDFKDTLLGVSTYGNKPIHDMLHPLHRSRPIYPLAWTVPILIDINGNGLFDPLDSAVDIGQ